MNEDIEHSSAEEKSDLSWWKILPILILCLVFVALLYLLFLCIIMGPWVLWYFLVKNFTFPGAIALLFFLAYFWSYKSTKEKEMNWKSHIKNKAKKDFSDLVDILKRRIPTTAVRLSNFPEQEKLSAERVNPEKRA